MKTSLFLIIFSVIVASQLIDAGESSKERKRKRDENSKCFEKTISSESDGSGERKVCTACRPTTTSAPSASSQSTTESSSSTNAPANSTVVGVVVEDLELGSCDLTMALYNVSLTLSGEDQYYLQEFILQIEIYLSVSVNVDVDDMHVAISAMIESFSVQYPSIWYSVSYSKIGNWGSFIDFKYCAIEINLEKSDFVVTLDSNNDCPLYEGMRKATRGNANAARACEDLIVEITAVLKGGGSKAQKWAMIYQDIDMSEQYSSDFKAAMENCHIDGFGSFKSFKDVTKVFDRSTSVSSVVSGDSNSCVLLLALQACFNNASLSTNLRSQAKQLHDDLDAYFKTTTDIKLRVNYCSNEVYSFLLLIQIQSQSLQSIQLGSWGTLYDLGFCSNQCTNYGCGNLNDGPYSPATTQAPVTVKPADCNSQSKVVVINQPQNTSILLARIRANYVTWNTTLQIGFNSYWNQLVMISFNSSATVVQRQSGCKSVMLNYQKAYTYKQDVLLNIYLDEWVGTIRQFCSCASY